MEQNEGEVAEGLIDPKQFVEATEDTTQFSSRMAAINAELEEGKRAIAIVDSMFPETRGDGFGQNNGNVPDGPEGQPSPTAPVPVTAENGDWEKMMQLAKLGMLKSVMGPQENGKTSNLDDIMARMQIEEQNRRKRQDEEWERMRKQRQLDWDEEDRRYKREKQQREEDFERRRQEHEWEMEKINATNGPKQEEQSMSEKIWEMKFDHEKEIAEMKFSNLQQQLEDKIEKIEDLEEQNDIEFEAGGYQEEYQPPADRIGRISQLKEEVTEIAEEMQAIGFKPPPGIFGGSDNRIDRAVAFVGGMLQHPAVQGQVERIVGAAQKMAQPQSEAFSDGQQQQQGPPQQGPPPEPVPEHIRAKLRYYEENFDLTREQQIRAKLEAKIPPKEVHILRQMTLSDMEEFVAERNGDQNDLQRLINRQRVLHVKMPEEDNITFPMPAGGLLAWEVVERQRERISNAVRPRVQPEGQNAPEPVEVGTYTGGEDDEPIFITGDEPQDDTPEDTPEYAPEEE
jgi:hypothetical protein